MERGIRVLGARKTFQRISKLPFIKEEAHQDMQNMENKQKGEVGAVPEES